jgi:hypothetical protein
MCDVAGCSNKPGQGKFDTLNVCAPCAQYLRTGKVGPTDSFLAKIASPAVREVVEAWKYRRAVLTGVPALPQGTDSCESFILLFEALDRLAKEVQE